MILALLACTPVTLHDDTRLNLDPFAGPVSLASPYLLGAQFDLVLDGPAAELTDYRLVSQDAGVLSLGRGEFVNYDEDDDAYMAFPTTAVGEGQTELVVVSPSGDEVLRGSVEVKAPDSFELRAAADLDREEDPSAVESPTVFVGGQSAFRVDFFSGSTQLAGAGGLSVNSNSASVATPDDSTFPDDADWLVVEPSRAGDFSVTVSTGGEVVGDVSFSAVKADAVASVDVSRESESGAEEGDPVSVLAFAEDAEGGLVYGVPFTWAEDGQPFEATGDQYVYHYDPNVTTVVTAEGAGRVISFTVHGRGDVYDSNDVACAVANVGPVAPAVLLGLLGLRRRRAARG